MDQIKHNSVLKWDVSRAFVKTSKSTMPEERELFVNESLFLSRSSHPNITKLIDCGINEEGHSFIVTEKLKAISTYSSKCIQQQSLNSNDLVSILNVIDYLAFLNLSHGDIKPEHFLRSDDGKVKLVDFAQVFSLDRQTLIGTSAYIAPEIFWQHGYSVQSDLFSLGLSFIGNNYQNDVVMGLMSKQGLSLKPWAEHDLQAISDCLVGSNPLDYCLKKMISYSPLDRQRSGREIVEYLISKCESQWTLAQYDAQIRHSLACYFDHSHWIYMGNPVLRKNPKERIRLKKCHDSCISAFYHNYGILKKFIVTNELGSEVSFLNKGISVCKLKYSSGQIPRLFPKSVAIPATFGIGIQPVKLVDKGTIQLEYDYHICQINHVPITPDQYPFQSESNSYSEILTKFGIHRRFAEGLRFAETYIRQKSVDADELLVLRSHQAYFLACLGNVKQADEIFASLESENIESRSNMARVEFHSCLGWHSFFRGKTDIALDNLLNAADLLEITGNLNLFSKAIVYNRLSSAVWLIEGSKRAIEINEEAFHYASLLGNEEVSFLILLNRCLYYGDASYLTDEKEVQRRLRKLSFFVKSPSIIISYLHNFAAYCLRIGDVERALLSIYRAYALWKLQKGSTADSANLISLLGNIFRNSYKLVKATSAFKHAAKTFLKFHTLFSAAKCAQNLAEINFIEGRSNSALRYLKLARSLYERSGQKLGFLETELLRLQYAELSIGESAEIEKLLEEYHGLNYFWGEFQALWLLAIHQLAGSNWVGFEHSLGQLTRLSGQMTSQNLQSDLNLITSIYKSFLQVSENGETETRLSFLDILKRRSQTLFEEQKKNLIYLLSANDSIFANTDTLGLIVKEFHLEGRFMKSDHGERDKLQNKADQAMVERFEVIRKIASLTEQSKNLDDYVSKVLDLTVSTLRASRGAIFITSKYTDDIEILGTSGCQKEDLTDIKNISRSLIHHALGGNSIFIRNTAAENKYQQLQSLIAKNIKSAICIPLKKEGEVFGAVYIDSLHFRTQFEEFDKTFLDTFGSIIAGGLSTSHRLQRLNAHYQRALNKGKEIGLKSSEALLLPSPEMQEIYKLLFKVSKTTFPVLLIGQTGSGKDVLARMIHENSSLSSGKMVAINCAAIPADHLEAEFFGVASKAFTDVEERQGKLELADNGTLFLDEIAELPLALQPKLLRVLETREIEPLGGYSTVKTVQFRLVSATNKNLKDCVSRGKFREDLYHRINDVVIKIPDLYKRPRDIEVLVHHFYSYFQNMLNVKREPIKDGVMNALLRHSWTGGIRELSKVVSNLVAFSDGSVNSLEVLPDVIQEALTDSFNESSERGKDESVMSKEYLLSALRKTNFNIREAARQLQMAESSLRYHIKRHKIELVPKGFRA